MSLEDIVDSAVDSVTTMLTGMRRLFVVAIAIALGVVAVCALAGDYGYLVQLGTIVLLALGVVFLVGKW
jgi:hypothetical protein